MSSDWVSYPFDQFITSGATADGAEEVLSSLPPPPDRRKARGLSLVRDESDWVLPHHATFASVWNKGFRTHYWRFDEALRKSIADAAAMRRDPLIHASLRRRQTPVGSLPIVVEPDNPRNPNQRAVAQRVAQIVEATPYFPWLKMSLLEAIFYGKAGVQLVWGIKRINGVKSVCVIDHMPIHGDKILWKWNKTPGVLMNQSEIENLRPQVRANIEETTGTYGPALFLKTKSLRRRFIIHRFEPTDQDYWLESDMAAAAMGLGLRSRLWFPWNTRNEILSWALDAIQRVGANGGLAGFFPHGNTSAKASVKEALVNLVRDHIAMFPYVEGTDPKNLLQNIPVNATGYDVLKVFTDYFDMLMREIILGESGPGSPINTRLAAELVEEGRFSVQRSDANALGETLTADLLAPIIEFNYDELVSIYGQSELDFGMKIKLQLEKPNSIEDLQSAQLLIGIVQADAQLRASGVEIPIDILSLVEKSGLLPPEGDPQPPPPQIPGPLPDNPTGPAGFEGQPRIRTKRPTRNEGGDVSRYASHSRRERYGQHNIPNASEVPGGSNSENRPQTIKPIEKASVLSSGQIPRTEPVTIKPKPKEQPAPITRHENASAEGLSSVSQPSQMTRLKEELRKAHLERPDQRKNLLGKWEFIAGPSNQGVLFGSKFLKDNQTPSGLERGVENWNKGKKLETRKASNEMFGSAKEPTVWGKQGLAKQGLAKQEPQKPAAVKNSKEELRLKEEYFLAKDAIDKARQEVLGLRHKAIEAAKNGDRSTSEKLEQAANEREQQLEYLNFIASKALARLEAFSANLNESARGLADKSAPRETIQEKPRRQEPVFQARQKTEPEGLDLLDDLEESEFLDDEPEGLDLLDDPEDSEFLDDEPESSAILDGPPTSQSIDNEPESSAILDGPPTSQSIDNEPESSAPLDGPSTSESIDNELEGSALLDNRSTSESISNEPEGLDSNVVFPGKEAARRPEEPFDDVIESRENQSESFPEEHATQGAPTNNADKPSNSFSPENEVVPGWERKVDLPTIENPLEVLIAPKSINPKKRQNFERYQIYANDPSGSSFRFEKYNGNKVYDVTSVGPGSLPACQCYDFIMNKLGKNRLNQPLIAHTCKHIDSAIENGLIPPVTNERITRAYSRDGLRELVEWARKNYPSALEEYPFNTIVESLEDA